LALFGQEIAIDLLVAIFKEDRFAAIAALCHMVRAIRNDDAGQASHFGDIAQKERIRNIVF
jgi:hypothetical protein